MKLKLGSFTVVGNCLPAARFVPSLRTAHVTLALGICLLLLSNTGRAADRPANEQQADLLWDQVADLGKKEPQGDGISSPLTSSEGFDREAYLEIVKRLPALAEILKSTASAPSSKEPTGSAAKELSVVMLELQKMQLDKQSHVVAIAILYGLDTREKRFSIARRRAFSVLFNAAKREPAGTSVVTIRVPGVTCHGRFLDSMREYVRDKNSWILRIDAELQQPSRFGLSQPTQTPTPLFGGAQPLPSSFAGTTEIRVYVDQPKSAADVARAFAESGRYSMKNWTVLQPQKIETLLEKPEDASAD